MNILFINSNLYGHINPTLGLVKQLTERGNHIHYFCGDAFRESVTEAGAVWEDYGSRMNTFLKKYKPTDRHPFFMLMEYILLYDEIMIPEIISRLKRDTFDLIICDSVFGGSCFLEQITNIPVACSHSSFAMSEVPVPQQMLRKGTHPQLDHCYQILDRIGKIHQINMLTLEQVFISKAGKNIVYTTQKFNGDSKVHGPEYLFAGPSLGRLQEEMDFPEEGNRIPIYISLGSLNTDHLEFYKICISAFRDTCYYIYMSVGKKCDISKLGDIPSNFCVRSFLPQLSILAHVKIFVTHGGFNSVNEALFFGVPMLVLPLVNDQHMVAKKVTDMQLGMSADIKELSPDYLSTLVKELILNEGMKRNVMCLSQEMKDTMNLDQVSEELEKYAELSRKG